MQTDQAKKTGDRLALLYQLSQTFNSSLDLDEVLNCVMDEVIAATQAERGFVMLKEETPGSGNSLVFSAARGLDQRTIDDPQFQISRSIAERVAQEGQPVLTSDAQADARFNIRQSVMMLGLRSILCVPLNFKKKVAGIIYVDNRLQAGIFTKDDLELLNAIASSAAIAIENARLYEVAVEKGRMERELQMAHKVQASLLPGSIPEADGWGFAARWQPAREVGGDYYDFIANQEGHIGLVIADVTDKGMPAALFMGFARSIVRASVFHAASPAEAITRANRLICADSTDALFVTLFYGSLDLGAGTLTYVNAGHNPPLLYKAGQDNIVSLTSTGIPLGVDPESSYIQQTAPLEPGDFIVLYTDGVTDALDVQEREFGMEALERTVRASRKAPAEEIADGLQQAVAAFTGAAASFDDITIVVAKRI